MYFNVKTKVAILKAINLSMDELKKNFFFNKYDNEEEEEEGEQKEPLDPTEEEENEDIYSLDDNEFYSTEEEF